MALYTERLSAGKTATQNAKKEIKVIQPKSITVSASSEDGVKSKKVSMAINDNVKVSAQSKSDGTKSLKLKYENSSETVSSSIKASNKGVKAKVEIQTPKGVNVYYSNDFWKYAYTAPASTMITFGSVINSIPNAAAVRVTPDKNGNLYILGVDGAISLEGSAKASIEDLSLKKVNELGKAVEFGAKAEAKAGGQVIYIDKEGGWSIGIRVGAEGSAEADLSKIDVKKVVSKVKKMITSGKFSKDGFDFVEVDGKVGVNVSYFAPPKYNVDADRNLLVHQQLGSLEYNYTLKPSVNFEHESSESGFSTTVQIGHHEGIIAFDNQKLENPMSYICGTQQVQELYKIREEVTPKVLKQVEFNTSNINK